MGETEGKKAASSWLNVAVDYGPLLVFLLVYRAYAPEGGDPVAFLLAMAPDAGQVGLLSDNWILSHS